MSIKIFGDKIVFPDSTEQKSAYNDSEKDNVYTKYEIDMQQEDQDTEIAKKADKTTVYTKAEIDSQQLKQDAEIDTKLGDAPSNGEQYVRKDGVWAELASADGGITDAPADGKTYGRKDFKWAEVVSDVYTKDEIDDQQDLQDAEIAKNAEDIEKNTADIETLLDDVDALTGSIIYKGSINATVTPAPAEPNTGDMWINRYNIDDPTTDYPVASGWAPVTEVKYDDKLIKTDTGWNKIESVVGLGTYTSGEVDELLDDKADKTDVYTKTEADTLLDSKADEGDSYTKAESDTELAKKADKATTYTKDEVDDLLEASSGAIVGNYTNKWADSVARDPKAGNLYLVNGMSF